MHVHFEHRTHPRIAARSKVGPPTTASEHIGINGKVALALTTAVGTMWCAYAFALLALVALPDALGGGLLPFVQWVSQTFIQLVMLSVIMVGQNVLGRASDKRAAMTYDDAEATFHTLVDERIRDILATGESVVRGNADRLTSCLVLATEERR